MSKQITNKPVAIAMGAALAGGLMGAGVANAAENPFGLAELNGGYMQVAAAHMEGKCGGASDKPAEGKCGGNAEAKPKEGACGEGKCGAKPAPKPKEGACGEGKCGGNK